jgi:hypothetical protein
MTKNALFTSVVNVVATVALQEQIKLGPFVMEKKTEQVFT